MIRLRVYSFVVCLFLILSFVAASEFGEVVPKDKDGNPIEPTITENGGRAYELTDGNQFTVDYQGGDTADYSNLKGSVVFSDAGKLVSGEFEVTGDGTYVIGNLKVPLKAGSKVVFKDGELQIDDPGSLISEDTVDFIDSEAAWDETFVTQSGDGVSYLDLDTVSIDGDGFFLVDPQGALFDEFTVYGEGRVYLFENDGDTHLDVLGSYVSVNPSEKRFTIGSNVAGGSVSVRANAENSYGLRSDESSDYVSFRSIGGSSPSYVSVSDRSSDGLVPNVDAVGLFAIDNDGRGLYRGVDNKIYSVLSGNVNTMFSSPGDTASPIEVHLFDLVDGEKTKLTDYEGIVAFGNDDAMGYGFDPSFVLGSRYGNSLGGSHGRYEAYELNYGISNTLAYNYNLNKETIEKMFGLRINDQVGYLNDPKNVRVLADTLSRIPKAAGYLKVLNFKPSRGRIEGLSVYRGSSHYVDVYGAAGQHPGVVVHEITHIFDYYSGANFDREWNAIGGRQGPHSRRYGASNTAESKATIGEVIFASDGWWKDFFAGRGVGYGNTAENSIRMAAKIAVMAKYGHIQDYDAARILRNANINVDPKDPVKTYNEIIARVRG